jgi:DNA-binding NarL/FixJ family response regulator
MSRIYIVDDHAMLRDGLLALLEKAGHEIAGETAGATQALADVAHVRPDRVLLDLPLDGRSGHELLIQMRGRDPAGPHAPAHGGTDRGLSPRERQILVMVARGKSSAAIGTELRLSSKTVDTYRSRLMAKLKLADVPAIVRWAIREGLVGLDE